MFKPQIEIYIVLIVAVVLLAFIHYFQLDFYFADFIYNKYGEWKYINGWFTNTVMHNYAKKLIIFLLLIYIFKSYLLYRKKSPVSVLYPRIVIIIALILGTSSISTLKLFFDVDCPWDLLRYGGEKPFFSLFEYDAQYLPSSRCFPAAHSSVGFTLLAVYFHKSVHKKKHKLKILTLVLFIGFSFGLMQQIRGAHFISHDFSSLIVVILVNFMVFSVAYRPNKMKLFAK